MKITVENKAAKFLIRLADTEMVLGQRLCEMCSNGPFLEEDIAMSNTALDLIGRAEELYKIIAEIEGNKHSADDYVYRRNEREYFSIKLVEMPNEDFAWTIARSYLHDVYIREIFRQLKDNSSISGVSPLAEKVLIEIEYNHEKVRDWMYRLGLGTEESNQRMQAAVDHMYRYVAEMFNFDDIDNEFISDTAAIEANWQKEVALTLAETNIKEPEIRDVVMRDYREGFHTEHLGHLLSELQYLTRAYPEAKW